MVCDIISIRQKAATENIDEVIKLALSWGHKLEKVIAGIKVEIVFKKIKNLNLSVLPPDGRVRVSVPQKTSEGAVERFVVSKLDWINKHRQRFLNKDGLPKQKREYVSGEKVMLWGRELLLTVIPSQKKNAVIVEGDVAYLLTKEGADFSDKEKTVTKWLRCELSKEVEKKLPYWEAVTGLKCESWQTKKMKTRWGTCNARDGRIWLNTELAKKPLFCLDYIIVHELGHLKIKNHGEDFKKYMDAFYPNWRNVRKILNAFAATEEYI